MESMTTFRASPFCPSRIILALSNGFTRPTLTGMLSGKRRIGLKSAQKIAVYLGRVDNWRDYVLIGPERLRQVLGLTGETSTN